LERTLTEASHREHGGDGFRFDAEEAEAGSEDWEINELADPAEPE
jgi:hypothetical protein